MYFFGSQYNTSPGSSEMVMGQVTISNIKQPQEGCKVVSVPTEQTLWPLVLGQLVTTEREQR